ncbi:MAG: threonine/serine exporter family protein [Candidatus Phosphoribacter baldrii]
MTSAPPPEAPDPATARKVALLCLHVADLMLDAGMSANDIVGGMLRITHAYGLNGVHIDLTSTSVTLSYHPPSYVAPLTILRVVQPGFPDYDKAQRTSMLTERIVRGLPIDDAVAAFDEIRDSPRRYPWWVSMVGNAGVSAGVALLFTTSIRIVLITFVVGCLIDRLIAWLDDEGVPPFFQQTFAAFAITLVAAAVSAIGQRGIPLFANLDPTLIVVGGIVMLVAGMLVVGAVQDAIDQFYVTATARLFEVVMRTAGIVVGIVLALQVTNALGIRTHVDPDPIALGPVPAQLVGAFVLSLAWALYCYAGPIPALLAGLMGLLGWIGYLVAIGVGLGEVPANTVGAWLVAFVSTVLLRRTTIPSFSLISAALLPLVPGLSLYNGLIQIVGTHDTPGSFAAGQATLGVALGVALGIAAGASLGVYLGRPIVSQLRRIRDRTARRADSPRRGPRHT